MRRGSAAGLAALLALTAVLGGCVRMAKRPPLVAPTELAGKLAWYAEWKLTPSRGFGGAITWTRSDGAYSWDQVADLALSQRTTETLLVQANRSQLYLAGGAIGCGVLDGLFVVPPVLGLIMPEVWLVAMAATTPVTEAQDRFAAAYDAALRDRIGLTGTAYGGDGLLEPLPEPAAGDVRIGLRGGAVLTRFRELDAFYGVAVHPKAGVRSATILAPPFAGLEGEVALGPRLAVAADWTLQTRFATIEYLGGARTDWDLSAQAAGLRLVWTALKLPHHAVTLSAGPAWVSLLGARITGDWFAGEEDLAGSVLGWTAEIGLDERLSDHLALGCGAGWRQARITPVTTSGEVDGIAVPAGDLRNADGTPAAADHSGVLLRASIRFGW